MHPLLWACVCMHVFAYLTSCNQTELNEEIDNGTFNVQNYMFVRGTQFCCDCCEWVSEGSLYCGKHLRCCSLLFIYFFCHLMSNYNNQCRQMPKHIHTPTTVCIFVTALIKVTGDGSYRRTLLCGLGFSHSFTFAKAAPEYICSIWS